MSKLKSRKDKMDDLLNSLVEIGLLKYIENGVITGLKSSPVYIKSLPITETLTTTNTFTLDMLDPINLPWLLYRQKCTNLLLPSNGSTLSSEVNQYLQTGIYQK